MVSHLDTVSPDMDSSSVILIGDKVKLICQGRLRTALVIGHYDGIITARIGDVVIRRDSTQVVATKRR